MITHTVSYLRFHCAPRRTECAANALPPGAAWRPVRWQGNA